MRYDPNDDLAYANAGAAMRKFYATPSLAGLGTDSPDEVCTVGNGCVTGYAANGLRGEGEHSNASALPAFVMGVALTYLALKVL